MGAGQTRELTPTLWPPNKDKPSRFDFWWRVSLSILAVVAIVCVAAVVIATLVLTAKGASFQRYCIDNDVFFGQFSVDSSARTMEWDLQYILEPTNVVTALHIYGPVLPGQTTGPLHLALCGAPSELACDTLVQAVLKDEIGPTHDGNSLKTAIREIRDFPRRYYLQLVTSMNSTGLIANLGTICGTAT